MQEPANYRKNEEARCAILRCYLESLQGFEVHDNHKQECPPPTGAFVLAAVKRSWPGARGYGVGAVGVSGP